jgi:hypothetical protein
LTVRGPSTTAVHGFQISIAVNDGVRSANWRHAPDLRRQPMNESTRLRDIDVRSVISANKSGSFSHSGWSDHPINEEDVWR